MLKERQEKWFGFLSILSFSCAFQKNILIQQNVFHFPSFCKELEVLFDRKNK